MKKILLGLIVVLCFAAPFASQAQVVSAQYHHHRHHHHHHHPHQA
jgi:Ni/Co efflux regulator RcnB